MKKKKINEKKRKINKKQLTLLFNVFYYLIWLSILLGSVYGLCKSFHNIAILQHNIDLSYNIALMTNDLNDYFNDTNSSNFIDYREYKDRMQSGRIVPLTDIYWESIFRIDNHAFAIYLFTILLVFSIFFISNFKFNK